LQEKECLGSLKEDEECLCSFEYEEEGLEDLPWSDLSSFFLSLKDLQEA